MISSPLKRCREVAKHFAQIQQLPFEIIDDFKECNFGDWDGVPFDDLQAIWPQVERFFYHPDRNHPPNGDRLEDFNLTVRGRWLKLIADEKQGHMVVVCHGGVIRQILAEVLDLDWRNNKLYQQLVIAYASVTRIEIDDYQDAEPRVKFIGAVAESL